MSRPNHKLVRPLLKAPRREAGYQPWHHRSQGPNRRWVACQWKRDPHAKEIPSAINPAATQSIACPWNPTSPTAKKGEQSELGI